PEGITLELADINGPTTLYLGPEDGETLKLAAAITAGFSKAPAEEEARLLVKVGRKVMELWAPPL
ncbi:MAG TPA: hypothetical protein VHY08_19840, partial [Bacillota bacterium]|nr:hypothetical protein [Bacillota bacterium]